MRTWSTPRSISALLASVALLLPFRAVADDPRPPEPGTVRVAGIVLKNNDPILQARSKENYRYIVFVHPAEFLVTGPDGAVLQRTILGDRLVIPPADVGSATDSSGVFYFDVPRTPREALSRDRDRRASPKKYFQRSAGTQVPQKAPPETPSPRRTGPR